MEFFANTGTHSIEILEFKKFNRIVKGQCSSRFIYNAHVKCSTNLEMSYDLYNLVTVCFSNVFYEATLASNFVNNVCFIF